MRDKFAGNEHWQLAKKHRATDNIGLSGHNKTLDT